MTSWIRVHCHASVSDAINWLTIVLFIGVTVAGVFVPLYTDEVALRMMRFTFFSEEAKVLSLMPQCNELISFPIPITLYPAAIFSAGLMSSLPPLGIRVLGIATGLLWLGLVVLVIILIYPQHISRLRWTGAIVSVLGLGVLPLTLILARSEQWLLVLLTACVLIPLIFVFYSGLKSRLSPIFLLFVFCLIVSLSFYAHPKALFFLPVFIASGYLIFRTANSWLALLAFGFIFTCAFQTFHLTKVLVGCPNAPVFSSHLASQTTKYTMLFGQPLVAVKEIATNLTSAPAEISKHLVFQIAYQSAWLPPATNSLSKDCYDLINPLIVIILSGSIYLASLLPPLVLLIIILKKIFGVNSIILLALWISFVGHLCFYKTWNFYGGGLVIGLAVLLIILSSAEFHSFSRLRLLGQFVGGALSFVFLGSAGILAAAVMPPLLEASNSGDLGLKNQPLSVQAIGFSERRDQIRRVAESCNLHGDQSRRLVVDDLTYFAFDDLKEPLHLVYFYEGGFGADVKGEATDQMLRRLGSPGIIAQCTYFPSIFIAQAHRENGLCCLVFP